MSELMEPSFPSQKREIIGTSSQEDTSRWEREVVSEEKIKKAAGKIKEMLEGIENPKALILGISYSPETEDMRESPNQLFLNELRQLGVDTDYADPYVPVMPNNYRFPALANTMSVDTNPKNLANYDMVIVATKHRAFDMNAIRKSSKRLVDIGEIIEGLDEEPQSQIEKGGHSMLN